MTVGNDRESQDDLNVQWIQARFQLKIESDLTLLGDGMDNPVIAEMLASLDTNEPALSHADIARIADQLADRVADRFEHPLKSEGRIAKFRNDMRATVIGVLSGLLATGALNLLPYLMHLQSIRFDGAAERSGDGAMQDAERTRSYTIRRRVLQGLSDASFNDLDYDTLVQERLKALLWHRVEEAIQGALQVGGFEDLPAFPDGTFVPVEVLASDLYAMVATTVAERIQPFGH